LRAAVGFCETHIAVAFFVQVLVGVKAGDASQTKPNCFQDSKATEDKTETEETNKIKPKTELDTY
jgi:hypothetical protein